MCGKDRETTLKLGAVAQRAFRCLAAAYQQLELLVAFLARVLEERHG
jgi:hypothetical protein